MCGIIGVFNSKNAVSNVALGLNVIKERGIEAYGICTEDKNLIVEKISELDSKINSLGGKNALGHCLHSVVGFVPQPLVGEGKLIANCEIYNWKDLNLKYSFDAKNDAELLLKLLDTLDVREVLSELDGVYAFAYWKENKLFIARDLLGIKPLWFSHGDGFAFCSEKKALEQLGFIVPLELNPRKLIEYTIDSNTLISHERKFYDVPSKDSEYDSKNESEIKAKTKTLLLNAVLKRVPNKKVGLLFSGGLDSTMIALLLKKLNVDFTCYISALDEPGLKQAEDLEWAQKAAEEMGLKLKVKKLDLNEVEKYLKVVVPLIEDTNVTKVGVGITFYAACELAKEDGVKVIFSGLGSEEIFAGYDRHKRTLDVGHNINNECYSGLLRLYERDTYRDDVITMANNLELRLPFLDGKLVEYALKIPADMKINSKNNKLILRKIAYEMGMPFDFSERKKKAAQYGSRFDSAIKKLANKAKCDTKSEYLKRFYPQKNLKLGALFSSGKDSTFAIHTMIRQNYEISCLITLKSKNLDSFMFHTPNIGIAKLQAECMDIPIIEHETSGKKEDELLDLKDALIFARKKYGIQGIVTGALFSNYQRERIEKVADEIGLKIFSPLWHMEQEWEFRNILDSGFKVMLSSVAADGLDKTWVGREITHEDIDKLVLLHKKIGLNIAGEGGEFESLVVDGPDELFKKKLEIVESEIIIDNESKNVAKWVVKKANVVDKKLSELSNN